MKKYDEKDPWKLAKLLGVIVAEEPLGLEPNSCKGFYLYHSRKKHITINSQLTYGARRIILAHELGHAILHSKVKSMSAFHDFVLYDTSSHYEYEANLFAAELLLEDQVVCEKLSDDTFFFSVANELEVPAELLDFKFRILKRKGWHLESPIMANSDFLKHLHSPEAEEWVHLIRSMWKW